jgi:GNAT superfamily N-acetyltransferase
MNPPAHRTERVGTDTAPAVRPASPGDAGTVAQLLDDFNREFDTPTPGVEVLTARLQRLLAGGAGAELVVLLVGDPARGVAAVSFRPSVWYDGPIATLDELYVQPGTRSQGWGSHLLLATEALARRRGSEELQVNVDGADVDARRFYERHGYRNVDPSRDDPMLLYIRTWRPDAEPVFSPARHGL